MSAERPLAPSVPRHDSAARAGVSAATRQDEPAQTRALCWFEGRRDRHQRL